MICEECLRLGTNFTFKEGFNEIEKSRTSSGDSKSN